MNQIVAIAIVLLYIVVPMRDSYISCTLVTIPVSYLISTLIFGYAFLIARIFLPPQSGSVCFEAFQNNNNNS